MGAYLENAFYDKFTGILLSICKIFEYERSSDERIYTSAGYAFDTFADDIGLFFFGTPDFDAESAAS